MAGFFTKEIALPTLKQVLDALKNQVLVGKSYLELAKGLLGADPVITQVSPTFFGLSIDGSLELAQMAIARLYDRTGKSVTVQRLLTRARMEVSSFQRGEKQEVTEAIAKHNQTVMELEPVLQAIRTRRNEWLAHLDPKAIANPKAVAEKAKLTLPDLDRAFEQTEHILIDLSSLYEGTIGELKFIDGDDYKTALNWIRKAKCAAIERYEAQWGPGSWTGPRPKDCSRDPLDLP